MKLSGWKRLGRDGVGGLLLLSLGTAIALRAQNYPLGTVRRMGPGFMPSIYGVLIAAVGLVLVATALGRGSQGTDAAPPDVRAAACILGGLAVFVAAGASLGLAPATFGAVFVAALADRGNSLRDAGLLAGALTVLAAVVFSWGLGLQLPLFRWF